MLTVFDSFLLVKYYNVCYLYCVTQDPKGLLGMSWIDVKFPKVFAWAWARGTLKTTLVSIAYGCSSFLLHCYRLTFEVFCIHVLVNGNISDKLVSVVYSIIIQSCVLQGVLVLLDYKSGAVRLPPTYYACVIASEPFTLIELLMVIAVYAQLPRIANRAQKHIVDSSNVELDSEGKPVKEKASLWRLVKLAKPVSCLIRETGT